MAKKYLNKKKTQPKKETKKKIQKREKAPKKKATIKPKKESKKEEKHHKFILKSAFEFEDVLSKVIPLKGGKYGALSESGEFLIFTINKKNELVKELLFQFPGANLFCQLGNGLFVVNNFDHVNIWELKGTKMNSLREYKSIFSLVIYSMEPIDNDYCALSGPSDIIELIKFDPKNKIHVIYLDYQKSKSKNKKGKKASRDFSPSGVGCLYFQKKHNRLLATHFNNILRVWDCDFAKNKYELYKEVDYITNFSGKIIHEMKNKILIGGRDVITILDNDNYEITDFVDLGNNGFDIFSMEIIKYHNFKEFVVCGLRNGKILGVDIENKRIEFVKTKKNDTGKDNEMNVKDGKLTFYGENISYLSKVGNTNMILVASHDHILKLFEY